jgi:hypothetical protein
MNTQGALLKGYVRIGDYIPLPVERVPAAHVGDQCRLMGGYRGVVVLLEGHEYVKITHSPFQTTNARRALMRKLITATGIVIRPPWYTRWARWIHRRIFKRKPIR